MAQKITKESANKKDKRANIQQIILKNELIYIGKAAVFCCFSPALEMIFDIISHLQNEKEMNYL